MIFILGCAMSIVLMIIHSGIEIVYDSGKRWYKSGNSWNR